MKKSLSEMIFSRLQKWASHREYFPLFNAVGEEKILAVNVWCEMNVRHANDEALLVLPLSPCRGDLVHPVCIYQMGNLDVILES